MKSEVVKWHGIRARITTDAREKYGRVEPVERDIAEASEDQVERFWNAVTEWAFGVLETNPDWVVNGTSKKEDEVGDVI